MIRCLVIFNHNDRLQASDLVIPQRCTRGSATGIRYLSKCAFQYWSETSSVWSLKKDQYKTCPSIKAPQTKNSIIVLLRLAGEEVRLELNCLKPDRARTVPTLSSFPNSLTRTAHPALSLRSPEPCCSRSSIFNRLQAFSRHRGTCFLRLRVEVHLYL